MSGQLFQKMTFPTTTIEGAASYIIDCAGAKLFSAEVTAVITSTAKNVANDTGVNITTDVLTSATHGFATGTKIRLTSTGTLPTGLALATDYYVKVLDANTFSLFTTLALALAAVIDGTGTTSSTGKVDITALGTAASTITVTPVSISGASYKLQKSNAYDPINNPSVSWTDLVAGESNAAITNTITVSGTSMVAATNVSAQYLRILFAVSAGSTGISVCAVMKQ